MGGSVVKRKKRERVRLTLSETEQNCCADVLMAMQQDPRYAGLNLAVHDIARQALSIGLHTLLKRWKKTKGES